MAFISRLIGGRYLRILNIKDIEPGMELGDDLISSSGIVFLSKGTIISARHIEMIEKLGFLSVSIEDSKTLELNIEPSQSEEFPNKTDDYDISLTVMYHSTVKRFRSVYEKASKEGRLEIDEVDKILTPILDKTLANNNIMSTFRSINTELGEYTFKHSINVAMLAAMLGKWVGFDERRVKELAMAGILHDIGKSKINPAIINKPSRLTDAEFQEIKLHATYGYEIVKNQPNISNDVKQGILQHHERIDGSGYPNGLKGKAIHPYGRILAVADVYDSMSSDRVYRKAECPFKVYDFILSTSASKLDIEYVSAFVKNISCFFIGNIVMLNTGDKGKIVMLNPTALTRPLVQTRREFVDLSKNYDIEIEEVL